MNTQLNPAEIQEFQQVLKDYSPAQAAFSTLEKHNGNLDTSFDELWQEQTGIQTFGKGKSLWEVTLKVLRQELCSDDGFRATVKEYTKKPEDAAALTAAIIYLAGLTSLPINPAIATIIVLYIVKIGLNIFCEYTEPVTNSNLPAKEEKAE